MTYVNPFAHNSAKSTPAEIITNQNSDEIYTVITEAEDYLGSPEFGSADDDINRRYDTIQHLRASEVEDYANSLVDDDREVAIFQGRLSNPANFPRYIPVGYVYPGQIWNKI